MAPYALMAAESLARERLRAGQDALRIAIAAVESAEDVPTNAQSLLEAQAHFAVAIELCGSQRCVEDLAQARLGLADATMRLGANAASYAAAEPDIRAAIGTLSVVAQADTMLDGYLLLAKAVTRPVANSPHGDEKEDRIEHTLGVLRAAEYVAERFEDSRRGALVQDFVSRALGERFRGDRDATLLDAVAAARRALRTMAATDGWPQEAYPSLLLHVGNCFMKLDGDRKRWLREGLEAYRDGLAAVDPKRCPRLQRLLTEHVGTAETLLAAEDTRLPEKEIVGRRAVLIQAALNAGDVAGADSAAWALLGWGSSLGRAPNVWVAEAHRILGILAMERGDAGDAQGHFYTAAAVLSAIDDPGGAEQAALRAGAIELLAEAVARLDQADTMDALVEQVGRAVLVADAQRDKGVAVVEDDPAAAIEHLNHGLAVFPYDPLSLVLRGIAHAAMSNPATAERDFEAALRLHPSNAAALLNSALMYVGIGRWTEAAAHLDRLIELNPDMGDAYRLRAECLERLGRTDDAAADLARVAAVTSDPNEREALESRISHLRGGA